jgi:hypothetical protein
MPDRQHSCSTPRLLNLVANLIAFSSHLLTCYAYLLSSQIVQKLLVCPGRLVSLSNHGQGMAVIWSIMSLTLTLLRVSVVT